MSGHAHVPTVSHDQPALPNQPFSSWLRTQTTLFISQIAALLGLVYFLASLIYYVAHAGAEGQFFFTSENIKMFVDYSHIVFMALFMLVLIRYIDDNEPGSYRVKLVYARVFNVEIVETGTDLASAEGSDLDDVNPKDVDPAKQPLADGIARLKRFKLRFLLFWCAMLVLYVVFAASDTYDRRGHRESQAEKPNHEETQLNIGHQDLNVTLAEGTSRAGSASGDSQHSTVLDKEKPEGSAEHESGGAAANNKGSNSVTPAQGESRRRDWNITISPANQVEGTAPNPTDADKMNQSARVEVHKLVFSILKFAFNNLSLLMVYLCFVSMYLAPGESKNRHRWHFWTSLIVMTLFTLLFPAFVLNKASLSNGVLTTYLSNGEMTTYNAVFYALSGTINAVVLALLIARLDSKLIGLSSKLICVLYSYAAIQPLFVAFEQGQTPQSVMKQITASVLVFAFVSKIYFFLIIMYALQTGRMLNYLVCFPMLLERAGRTKYPSGGRHFKHEESTNWGMRQIDRVERYVYFRLGRKFRVRFNRRMKRLSLWFRSEAPLKVSKWLGFWAICAFFICLIGFLIVYRLNLFTNLGANDHTLLIQVLFRLKVAVNVAQLIVVGGMIVAILQIRKDNSCHANSVVNAAEDIFSDNLDSSTYSPSKARKHIAKFKEYFLWFWIVTFLLYLVLIVEGWRERGILTASQLMSYPFLTFFLSSVNLLFIFWCFVVLQSPAYDYRSKLRQKLLINYSSFVIGLLVAAFALFAPFAAGSGPGLEDLRGFATVFNGITGTLSGVALALLIARLDSKLFNLRSPLVLIMFAYAAIQPLFVVFELNEQVFKTIEAVVLLTALGLKVSFFLVIMHTLQSGKMLNYLVCFPFLRDRVDSIFENQFEIRTSTSGADHNLFTFTVWKKNRLIYSTASHFHSREECDVAIKELRDLVPVLNPRQQPPEVAGTYWVEIRDHRHRLICESIPLRSERERVELIKESKRNIPFCKYLRV
jgi:hypothetical protein